MTPPMLEVREVTRAFPSGGEPVPVLRGIDLAVRSGELVTLAGPSGSGKSALFAVLCGFDLPDAGAVLLRGEGLAQPPSWKDCAVLPQAMGLADELTIAENVALPLRLAGAAVVAERVADLLRRLDIAALARRYPSEVSFGQQQRAALARAVASRPGLLLADEPTAHLDHATIPRVVALLRDVTAEGTAVLVATHDPVVHAAADRRLRLTHGRVVTDS